MSIPDFDSDLGPDLAVSVYAARFTDTATDPADELNVVVPALDDGRSKLAVEWAPNGTTLPSAGDPAWVTEAVALDGDSTQWVVVMWHPASS